MLSPAVLLVAPPDAAVADVSEPLVNDGFPIVGPAEIGPSVLAAVLLADDIDNPVAFTRKLRHELPPSAPILWLLTRSTASLAPAGLEAGADVCLMRPVFGPLLVAQLRAAIRARTVASNADEVRDLTLRLQSLYEQSEQDRSLAERLLALSPEPQAIPAVTKWRFGVAGPDGVEILWRGTEIPSGFVLHEVAGLGAMGQLASAWIGQALVAELGRSGPAAALTEVNRRLRQIVFPDRAIVSATVMEMNPNWDDKIGLAVAGFPAPVLVHPDGPAEVWLGSGPFLGTTDTQYHDTMAQLKPGEKLIVLGRNGSDLRPDVRDLADRHRSLAAPELAEAIVAGLGVAGVSLIVAECRNS